MATLGTIPVVVSLNRTTKVNLLYVKVLRARVFDRKSNLTKELLKSLGAIDETKMNNEEEHQKVLR